MSRLTYLLVLFASLLFIWLLPLYYPLSANMFSHFPTGHLFWKLLPLEGLVLWGLYAAASVLNAVRNVKDFPESKTELLEDIKAAQEALSKSGFDWN